MLYTGRFPLNPLWITQDPTGIKLNSAGITSDPAGILLKSGWIKVDPSWITLKSDWIEVDPAWITRDPARIMLKSTGITPDPGCLTLKPARLKLHTGRILWETYGRRRCLGRETGHNNGNTLKTGGMLPMTPRSVLIQSVFMLSLVLSHDHRMDLFLRFLDVAFFIAGTLFFVYGMWYSTSSERVLFVVSTFIFGGGLYFAGLSVQEIAIVFLILACIHFFFDGVSRSLNKISPVSTEETPQTNPTLLWLAEHTFVQSVFWFFLSLAMLGIGVPMLSLSIRSFDADKIMSSPICIILFICGIICILCSIMELRVGIKLFTFKPDKKET